VSQFFRIVNVFQTLPKSPSLYISIEDLLGNLKTTYDPFNAPRKTLQRDLKTLNKILNKGNIEKIVASGRRSASYRLSSDAQLDLTKKNIIQSEFQSLAIIHSYNFLKPYFPESWQNTLTQQFEQAHKVLALKNKNVWLTKFGFALEGAFQNYLTPKNEIKELIFNCIHQDDYWLKILYHPESFKRQPNVYTVKPHGVIVRGRKQYLIASKINGNNKIQIRTFTMHRILQAEKIPERLSIDIPDIDMQKAIEQYEFEGYYNDDKQPQSIQLKCSNKILSELSFSKIHETQQLFNNTLNSFSLTAEMPITHSLIEWLVQIAQLIEVEQPIQLRDEVKYRLIDMAQNYAIDIIEDENESQDMFSDDLDEKSEAQSLGTLLSESEENLQFTLTEIFLQAVEFIRNEDTISAAKLQRKFLISYNSAAKIMDQMRKLNYIQFNEKQSKYIILI
jgi:WYL domain/Ftsk gamma domain